jgi:hypothetical protein
LIKNGNDDQDPCDDREQAREIQQIHAIPGFVADASGDDTEDRRSANIELPLNSVVESATGAISEGRAGADSLLRLPGNSATAGSAAGWSGSV